MKFLELYIGAIIMWTILYFGGKEIYEIKKKNNQWQIVIVIMFFSILISLINMSQPEMLEGIIKILLIYTITFFFNKIIFNKNVSQTIVGSLVMYLSLFISETIIAIIISGIFYLLDYKSMLFLKNTIFINLLITALAYSIIKINKTKLKNLIKNSKFEKKSNYLIILLILITITTLLFKIPLSNWQLNIEFLLTMLLLLCFTMIGFVMIKQSSDIQRTTSKYQKLVDYSDITNNLLEDYRIVSHEQKNQLLIIRSMLDDSSPKELVDYVDSLLEKKVGFKYEWIGDLNHLPLSGLKGLINYKLIEAHTIGIDVNISISKDVTKTKLNQLSTYQKDELYSIMGVYLDNAIQAAKEAAKKEVSLEIYKENQTVVIIIANTYKGQIEFDKLDNYGYTTKGKNHGIGLHLVKKIIENETIYFPFRSLFEDYYVQKLIINLSNIK